MYMYTLHVFTLSVCVKSSVQHLKWKKFKMKHMFEVQKKLCNGEYLQCMCHTDLQNVR